jgi:hypothetical protein
VFTFIPDRCSESSRNRVHVPPESPLNAVDSRNCAGNGLAALPCSPDTGTAMLGQQKQRSRNVTLAIAALFSAALSLATRAQSPSWPGAGGPKPSIPSGGGPIPQRLDLQEEIESLQEDSPGVSGFRAEYKSQADAATHAGADSANGAASAPPGTISAQRLRHHPSKAARRAFAQGIKAQQNAGQAYRCTTVQPLRSAYSSQRRNWSSIDASLCMSEEYRA